MRSGYLRHVLIFQTKTVTRDTFGAEVETWAESFRVHGAVEPKKGSRDAREFQEATKRQSELVMLFRIRYRSGIGAGTHRIYYDSKVWDICDPIPDARQTELTIEGSVVQ